MFPRFALQSLPPSDARGWGFLFLYVFGSCPLTRSGLVGYDEKTMSETSGSIRLTFYGGIGEVTGANFLLEIPTSPKPIRVLVDCGLFQGTKMLDEKNHEKFPYPPESIDYLFVTHAHIDHTGRIPKIVRDGFRGKIYSTIPTKDLAAVMLEDSMGVLGRQARVNQLPELYNEADIAHSISLWEGREYHEPFEVVSGLSVQFLEAGHTLGSSMVEFSFRGKKIVFTGDLGNSPAPLLRNADALVDTDYLIMESVYGDRVHEHPQGHRHRARRAAADPWQQDGRTQRPRTQAREPQSSLGLPRGESRRPHHRKRRHLHPPRCLGIRDGWSQRLPGRNRGHAPGMAGVPRD